MKITIEAENDAEKASLRQTEWKGIVALALLGNGPPYLHDFGPAQIGFLQSVLLANMTADTLLRKLDERSAAMQQEAVRQEIANGRGMRLHQ